jgi:7-carboxy-7-deazaguanine synthase
LSSGKRMPIHEVFGPTIQGEGMVVGRKTMFVRTGGCDYSCSWCDSAFTWNGEEKATMMTAAEVFDKLQEVGTHTTYEELEDGEPIPAVWHKTLNFNHVTISGGNPALIGEPMEDLIDLLHEAGIQVGLETQGTFFKSWMLKIDDLTISPKPPSSKMVTNWEKLDDMVTRLAGRFVNYSLKVVIFDDADFEYAKQVYERYKVYGPVFYVSVGNEDSKEQGDISARLIDKLDWLWGKVLADPAANSFRPLPQLHTIVWANKRAV